jgi:hypothetical protein
MVTQVSLAALMSVLSATAAADKDALSPRLTADVAEAGHWSVGIFNPLRVSVTDSIELESHPLYLFVSPHVLVRHKLLALNDGWRLTGEYGISVPTPALGMAPPLGLQSYFTPSCLVAAHDSTQEKWCKKPGWFAIPRLGVVASYGQKRVYTLSADVAFGIHLAGEPLQTFDTFTPLELLFAPASKSFRAHLGARYDRAVLSWLRLSTEIDFYLTGEGPSPGRSPFVFAAHLGVDVQTTKHTRLTLGAKYFNSDLKEAEIEIDQAGFSRLVHIRSNDFYPTLDFIWSY